MGSVLGLTGSATRIYGIGLGDVQDWIVYICRFGNVDIQDWGTNVGSAQCRMGRTGSGLG